MLHGKPLNNRFLEIPICRINDVNQKINQGHEFSNPFEIFNLPEEFDKKILRENGLTLWEELIPSIKLYEEVIGLYSSLKFINTHIQQLMSTFQETDSIGL